MEDIQNRTLLTTTENRFSSWWSRQRKFDQSKLIKPPTCYYCRKEGHLISSCPEKRRVAQKQNSMEPKPTVLSLSHRIYLLLVKIHFPEFQQRRLGQVLWVKSVVSLNLSWTFLSPSFTMAQCHYQVIHLTPYRSRFEKNWSPQSLLLFVFSEKSSTGANVLIRGISS